MHEGPTENRLGELGSLYKYYYYYYYKDEDQCQSKEKCNVTDGETGYPPFSVFCNFLQRESRIARNPVTSVRPQKEEVRKEDSYRERRSNSFNRRNPKR